jgi:hypothetical protein
MIPGLLEGTLAVILLGGGVMVVRAVGRRRQFQKNAAEVVLPNLQTSVRVTGTLQRLYRDTAQGVTLATLKVGERILTFCPTDDTTAAGYALGEVVSVALFALSTLEPGGFEKESVRSLVRDVPHEELTPERTVLAHAGEFANDYWIVGHMTHSRRDAWDDMELVVYNAQTQVVTLELAVPEAGKLPGDLPMQAHGSARLFGYLAE